jgi:hypothetical protein
MRPGLGGFFSPAATTSSAASSLVSDSGIGIAPGDPCYDATHDPGKVHCGSGLDALIFSNVVTACSASELACAAGQLVSLNPPTTPVNYNPQTGDANSGSTLEPSGSSSSVIPCADGSIGPCQTLSGTAPGTPGTCAWYCGLPLAGSISPTYASDCAACGGDTGNISTFVIVAAALVLGLAFFNKVK